MLCMNKYESEILALKGNFAKIKGKIEECADIKCPLCDFNQTSKSCTQTKFEWLYSEYKAPKVPGAALCPHCGNTELDFMIDEESYSQYAVVCDTYKGGCGASSGYCTSREEAVESWNRRVYKTADQVPLSMLGDTILPVMGVCGEVALLTSLNILPEPSKGVYVYNIVEDSFLEYVIVKQYSGEKVEGTLITKEPIEFNGQELIFLNEDNNSCFLGYQQTLEEFLNEDFQPLIPEPREITWAKVPKDAPVYVSHDGRHWGKSHFSHCKDGKVFCFKEPYTSWTTPNNETVSWKYTKYIVNGVSLEDVHEDDTEGETQDV